MKIHSAEECRFWQYTGIALSTLQVSVLVWVLHSQRWRVFGVVWLYGLVCSLRSSTVNAVNDFKGTRGILRRALGL